MSQELIKSIIKVGNSAGVLLPIEWYGGKAKIELLEKPLNIKRDVFEILEEYLGKILGIYLVGSYARKEENNSSDVDILVVTSDLNKKIIKGKYEIVLISLEELEKACKIVVPIIPMLFEAVSILNENLLKDLRKNKIKKEHLKWHLTTTKSALKIIKNILDLGEEYVSAELVYSLILRLREAYVINQILKNRKPTKKGFLEILKKNKIHSLYSPYELKKRGKKSKRVSYDEAKIAYDLLVKMLK